MEHGAHPIGSRYDIYSYIYHKTQPNVGKYISTQAPQLEDEVAQSWIKEHTIHGSYGHGT